MISVNDGLEFGFWFQHDRISFLIQFGQFKTFRDGRKYGLFTTERYLNFEEDSSFYLEVRN